MKRFITFGLLVSVSLFSTLNISAQKTRRTKSADKTPRSQTKASRFEAFSDGSGVYLRWAEFGARHLGYNVYRIAGGEKTLVNKSIITSLDYQLPENAVTGGDYNFFDVSGGFGSYYLIESVSAAGQRAFIASVYPQAVPDLTPFAGSSSSALRQARIESQNEMVSSSLIVPDDLQAEIEAGVSEADSSVQKWLASQPGVKIGVKQEGIYRVTRAQLEAAGFDVNSSRDLWQLYLNGIEQSMIVAPNGDYIEFYGKGIDALETDTQIYFLIVGSGNGKRIADKAARRVGGNVVAPGYLQSFVKKERVQYISTVLNGDEENFYGALILNSGTTVNFDLSGLSGEQSVLITLTLNGLSVSNHSTRVVLNGVELGTVQGFSRNRMVQNYNISSSVLREGSNTLQLTSSASNDISMFDNIKLTFQRKYIAQQNQLSFYTNNYRTSELTGFSSPNVRVFDITDPNNPAKYVNLSVVPESGSYTVKLPAYRSRLMFAAADEAVKQPASIVRNAPSTLSSNANGAELIIIKHQNFSAQADSWANYRRGQGVSVAVVDVEDVYDEFNFGNASSNSIRNFLQFAKNNWQTPPKYVLLIGDASYDPRNYTGNGYWNLVPSKMVDTLYMETGSDDSLTDFDNDGLAEIPIGRIPARNPSDVTLALNKVTAFEQTASQAVSRGTLCVSDAPEGYDFAALCTRVFDELPAGVNKAYLNRTEANAPGTLLGMLNGGKYFVNYSGHGSISAWSSQTSFFNANIANQLTNQDLTVFTLLTCLNGYFVDAGRITLSENGLFAPGGGAVAHWSSTGMTTPDVQEIMAKRFYKQLGTGSMIRLGDLIKDAKSVIPAGRDVLLSWALLGDPMLKVK